MFSSHIFCQFKESTHHAKSNYVQSISQIKFAQASEKNKKEE